MCIGAKLAPIIALVTEIGQGRLVSANRRFCCHVATRATTDCGRRTMSATQHEQTPSSHCTSNIMTVCRSSWDIGSSSTQSQLPLDPGVLTLNPTFEFPQCPNLTGFFSKIYIFTPKFKRNIFNTIHKLVAVNNVAQILSYLLIPERLWKIQIELLLLDFANLFIMVSLQVALNNTYVQIYIHVICVNFIHIIFLILMICWAISTIWYETIELPKSD